MKLIRILTPVAPFTSETGDEHSSNRYCLHPIQTMSDGSKFINLKNQFF